MEIRYNVTGAKRKELVKVIANATGARAELIDGIIDVFSGGQCHRRQGGIQVYAHLQL